MVEPDEGPRPRGRGHPRRPGQAPGDPAPGPAPQPPDRAAPRGDLPRGRHLPHDGRARAADRDRAVRGPPGRRVRPASARCSRGSARRSTRCAGRGRRSSPGPAPPGVARTRRSAPPSRSPPLVVSGSLVTDAAGVRPSLDTKGVLEGVQPSPPPTTPARARAGAADPGVAAHRRPGRRRPRRHLDPGPDLRQHRRRRPGLHLPGRAVRRPRRCGRAGADLQAGPAPTPRPSRAPPGSRSRSPPTRTPARRRTETTAGWYAGCTSPRMQLLTTHKVKGVGDEAMLFVAAGLERAGAGPGGRRRAHRRRHDHDLPDPARRRVDPDPAAERGAARQRGRRPLRPARPAAPAPTPRSSRPCPDGDRAGARRCSARSTCRRSRR